MDLRQTILRSYYKLRQGCAWREPTLVQTDLLTLIDISRYWSSLSQTSGGCQLPNNIISSALTLDLVSKWRGHTVATTFLLRGHCQTCAGCAETIFYVSTGRHLGISTHDAVAFLEREREMRETRRRLSACVHVRRAHSRMNSDNFEPICHNNK